MLDLIIELRHTNVVKIKSGISPVLGHPSHDGHTRREIVRYLVESGPITAAALADRLSISAAGVRRHLDALIDAGDAQANAPAAWQQVSRGRPAKRYQLTAAGRAKLEHTYDDLASAAMRQLRELGGDEAIRAFARQRIDTILSEVTAEEISSDHEAEVSVTADRVAGALTKAGYATTTTKVEGAIHGIQLCQHHCPISHVAQEFPELCDAELQAMSELLGTHVQRLATIANGDCVCTTHVPLMPARSARNMNKTDSPPLPSLSSSSVNDESTAHAHNNR